MSSEAIDAMASSPMYSSKSSLPKSIAKIAAGSIIASLQRTRSVGNIIRKDTIFMILLMVQQKNRNIEVIHRHIGVVLSSIKFYTEAKKKKKLTLRFLIFRRHHMLVVELDHSILGKPPPEPDSHN